MSHGIASRGMCVFCHQAFAGAGIVRHLKACKARQAAIATQAGSGAAKTKLFHLSIKGTYDPIFWLNLEVPASATLYDLDQFLRDTWLECCGHLSMFKIMGSRYQSTLFEDGWWGDEDRDMNVKLGKVLAPGLEFSHEYDFGTTTYLTLRVVEERTGVAQAGKLVQVLARNELPDFRCEECDQTASAICTWCDYVLLCDKCIESHACGDEGLLPVVNSPRMGMCGYTGDAW
jgi:hypothetical protein